MNTNLCSRTFCSFSCPINHLPSDLSRDPLEGPDPNDPMSLSICALICVQEIWSCLFWSFVFCSLLHSQFHKTQTLRMILNISILVLVSLTENSWSKAKTPSSLGFSRIAGLFQMCPLSLFGCLNTSTPLTLPSHLLPGLPRPPADRQPVRLSGGNVTFRLGPAASWLHGWKPRWLTGSECLHAGKTPSSQPPPWLKSFLPSS